MYKKVGGILNFFIVLLISGEIVGLNCASTTQIRIDKNIEKIYAKGPYNILIQ